MAARGRRDADVDAVVIGGGHAGIEASLALARLGFSTILVTQNLDTIGRMSCNPAIGGIAKGNLVREIDALGGQMAKLIDASMIQFRMLNASRGPAVQAPRAQADKALYAALARQTLESQNGLSLFQDTVVDLLQDPGGGVSGVLTERGNRIMARAVVLTTGHVHGGQAFHRGMERPGRQAGRARGGGAGHEPAAKGLHRGQAQDRARRPGAWDDPWILRAWSCSSRIPSCCRFPFPLFAFDRPSIPCWVTYTNEKTHAIIRDNIHRSPLYGGKIVGRGPRYCPSIEDKVVRFPQRARHQVFVEPEGQGTDEVYLNGVSSSLPEDVQNAFLHTMRGLENLQIMQAGLRGGVRLPGSDPAPAEPHDASPSRGSSSRARQMAPPATRRPPRRGCWPGSTRPCTCSHGSRFCCPGPRPTSG